MSKVIAENEYWKLILQIDDGGIHLGSAHRDDHFSRGMYLNADQIDDVIFSLLRAKRKGKL